MQDVKLETVAKIEKDCESELLKNITQQKQCWEQLIKLKLREKKLSLILTQAEEVRKSYHGEHNINNAG